VDVKRNISETQHVLVDTKLRLVYWMSTGLSFPSKKKVVWWVVYRMWIGSLA
jgi:hypothetical protein